MFSMNLFARPRMAARSQQAPRSALTSMTMTVPGVKKSARNAKKFRFIAGSEPKPAASRAEPEPKKAVEKSEVVKLVPKKSEDPRAPPLRSAGRALIH